MACRKKGFRYRCAYTATRIQNLQYLVLAGRWNNSSKNWCHHPQIWTEAETELEQSQHIRCTAAAYERPCFDIEMPDDTIYLARYFGDRLYYADTAVAKNQTVVFNKKELIEGVYALVCPGPKYFEFIIFDFPISL